VNDVRPGRLQLDVETRERDGTTLVLVRARGEVDLSTADDLAATLRSRPCADSDAVVLDLSEVPFMDSSGLKVLLIHADGNGSMSLILRPGSPVRRLLEMAEVSERLQVFATEDEALDAIEP
jgi:anti-anti-sigma factor